MTVDGRRTAFDIVGKDLPDDCLIALDMDPERPARLRKVVGMKRQLLSDSRIAFRFGVVNLILLGLEIFRKKTLSCRTRYF
jgi:hypothetical protein